MPLLCSNTQLDRAIERLDHVIAQFPALISARHARGTAHFRKWLNSAPIQLQQLRAGPLSYAGRFGEKSETPVADALALHRARRDFAAILDRELLPTTLASLAVLEAYAGLMPAAMKRAERALRLAPEDLGVLNHVGVIRFLNGDLKEASAEFVRASQGPAACWPWLVFNNAKCAAMLNDPMAPRLLRQYLLLDPATEWRREALRLLGDADEVSARMAREPPAVFPDITLRTPMDRVIQNLGTPSREEHWRDLLLWNYPELGLELLVCPRRGTMHVELFRPNLGRIEGIRVGDPLCRALEQWGNPVESGEGQSVFWTGQWGVAVEHDDRSAIVTLSLGAIQ